MKKSIFTYAWDVLEEGTENAFARIRDLGANTVALAASYHAGKFLRPRAPKRHVYFPEDGTVYFQPDLSHYGTLQPQPNGLVAERDLFRDWETLNPGLDLTAWTVGLHNTRLGQAHPQFCSRNAFGDPYFYSLCPAFPEVRDYLSALCLDIARHEAVSTITLETPGWLPYSHGYHHEFALVPLNSWAEHLLALCFSEATCNAGRKEGIDMAALQRWVGTRLERFLAEPLAPGKHLASPWLIADLLAEPELVAYHRMRCRVVTDLIQEIREVLPRRIKLRVTLTVQRPSAGCWIEGHDLAALASVADGLDSCAYQSGPTEIFEDSWDVRNRVGDETDLSFVLRPVPPDLSCQTDVVTAVQALRSLNPSGIAFYNYGFLREAQLDWVQDAFTTLDGPA